MGKIGLIYGEANSLLSNTRKCIGDLEAERNSVDKALNELNGITSGYSEVGEIRSNLNSVKTRNTSEINKLTTFSKSLDTYINNIKYNNIQVYKMKEK